MFEYGNREYNVAKNFESAMHFDVNAPIAKSVEYVEVRTPSMRIVDISKDNFDLSMMGLVRYNVNFICNGCETIYSIGIAHGEHVVEELTKGVSHHFISILKDNGFFNRFDLSFESIQELKGKIKNNIYEDIHADLSRWFGERRSQPDGLGLYIQEVERQSTIPPFLLAESVGYYIDDLLYKKYKNKWTKTAENKARKKLKEIVTKEEYKSYKNNNYIDVLINNKIYRLHPGDKMTGVYKKDKLQHKLCIIFKDKRIPPTDSLIMRYLLLKCSPRSFFARANKVKTFADQVTFYTAGREIYRGQFVTSDMLSL
jgi:hypothetical protein